MQIDQLFRDNIHRNIKGVITVGGENRDEMEQELREYVVTRELDKHFRSFLKAYNDSLTTKTDKIGVWIAGFFGSGKSHFLKMLGYLLGNREVNGRRVIDYFRDKFPDPAVYADLQRAVNAAKCEVLLFNIDARAQVDAHSSKNSIVAVLLNVFNGHLGYSPRHPALAALERDMDRSGKFDAFKKRYEEITGGTTWDGSDGGHEGRDTFDFDRDLIVRALVKSGAKNSEEEADRSHQAASTKDYQISIEEFSKLVRVYLDAKGPDHRLLFLIDEVGQYIGSNTKLMLNLQTVSEEFGKAMAGRGWLIVTAQEKIDQVVKEIKGDDFSKIQGRFATRLTLSSSNADEVIKRRLLSKTDVGVQTLKAVYAQKAAALRNAIHFTGAAEMKGYESEESFVSCYPFIPYQFTLLQVVFTKIRTQGETGKHLASGERSLLSGFQEAAVTVADKQVGVLVPLHVFYDSLEAFLDSSVARVVRQACDNGKLEPQDIDVLKTLFMVKHVKEVPKTLDDIVTLSLSSLDEDKIALRQRISGSLDRLVGQTLVEKLGDEYLFLTDDEQDVERGIKQTEIDQREVIDFLAKLAFDEIYGSTKLSYKYGRAFQIEQSMDGVPFGKPGHPLRLEIVTPEGDGWDDDQALRAMKHMAGGVLLLRLPEGPYLAEAETRTKTDKYCIRNFSRSNSAKVEEILTRKKNEIVRLAKRIRDELEKAIVAAHAYLDGAPVQVQGKGAKERIDSGLRLLADAVFRKFNLIDSPVRKDVDVQSILRFDDVQQLIDGGWGKNEAALGEVSDFILRQATRSKRITMRDLLDEFTGKPYGWSDLDVQALVARLIVAETIQARLGNAVLPRESDDLFRALVKSRDADKLVIQLQAVIDTEGLDAARKVLRNLVGRTDWSEKPNAFHQEAVEALKGLRSRTQSHAGEYRIRAYPGKSKVEAADKAVGGLLAEHDTSGFFKAMKDQQADLLDLADDLEKVHGFFDGQRGQWDSAMDILDRCDTAELFLAEETKAAITRIREIAEMPHPYASVHELPQLADKLKRGYDKVLMEQRQQAAQDVQNHLKAASDYIDVEGFSDAEKATLLKPLAEFADRFNTSDDLLQVKSLAGGINDVYQRVLDEAARLKASQLPKPGGGTPPPPPKKVRRVPLSQVVSAAKPMKTPEDVDAFVEELRGKLKDALKDNDEVRLT